MSGTSPPSSPPSITMNVTLIDMRNEIGVDRDAIPFLDWFMEQGGWISNVVNVTSYPGMGRGMIATENIEADTLLFRVPRSLLLNTANADLKQQLSPEDWESLEGWCKLILILMYENTRPDSKWRPYLDLLPTEFDGLMFWSEEELTQLHGSAVVDKIGKASSEAAYTDSLLPVVTKYPEIFGDASQYSLANYHRMGSLILSRSFTVDGSVQADIGDDGVVRIPNATGSGATEAAVPTSDAMDVDEAGTSEGRMDDDIDHGDGHGDDHDDGAESDEEERAGETVEDIAMVPLADILNAVAEKNNAHLVYETGYLSMVSTEPIPRGAQVYNTYGEPPQNDLLRRYGHVEFDLETMSAGGTLDVVELPLECIASSIFSDSQYIAHNNGHELTDDEKTERIEWVLECENYYMDESLDLDSGAEGEPSEDLISAVAGFLYTDDEFKAKRHRNKLPSPRMNAAIAFYIILALKRRLSDYLTSIQADEALLTMHKHDRNTLQQRNYFAIVVRLGEKRVLQQCIDKLQHDYRRFLDKPIFASQDTKNPKKRNASHTSTASSKKRK